MTKGLRLWVLLETETNEPMTFLKRDDAREYKKASGKENRFVGPFPFVREETKQHEEDAIDGPLFQPVPEFFTF